MGNEIDPTHLTDREVVHQKWMEEYESYIKTAGAEQSQPGAQIVSLHGGPMVGRRLTAEQMGPELAASVAATRARVQADPEFARRKALLEKMLVNNAAPEPVEISKAQVKAARGKRAWWRLRRRCELCGGRRAKNSRQCHRCLKGRWS